MTLAQAAFSLGLIALSGWLIDQHRRVWSQAKTDHSLAARDRRFSRVQFWRRMIASSTIGVVGVLIALKQVIPEEPLPVALYLAALLLACLVILGGGVVDAYANARFHHRTLRRRQRRQARMMLELVQAAEQTGGRSVAPRSGDT